MEKTYTAHKNNERKEPWRETMDLKTQIYLFLTNSTRYFYFGLLLFDLIF